ncbi:glycoside hydrolase family 95 protein [Vararia minispora EC-137]|uniref:Glycoside hydrolase family 95 protein n=1 Tax=Vararia minispora EC-137 TaxID=1314806 RepID=A0ACB8QFI0_9AGAM|nr:glycoside hydrolase family 95 protein [Vararia minispora EC-137]
MQVAFSASATCAAVGAPSGFPQSGNGLWYTSPGTQWLEYLPIGNGFLAAMLPGGTSRETTQLNIESLWSGGPFVDPNYTGQNKPASDRAAIAEFVQKSRRAVFSSAGSYAGAGYLISTLNISGTTTDYGRWLDLDLAVARTKWTQSNSTFLRTSFCSNPAKACVEHINSTNMLPGITYAFSPYLETGLPTLNVTCLDSSTLQVRGNVINPGVLYEVIGRVQTSGGNVSCSSVQGSDSNVNATLHVTGGTEAWITWVGGTDYDINAGDAAHKFSFQGPDPHESLVRAISTATGPRATSSTVLDQHVADYSSMVSKFSLSLGQTPDFGTPTDKLVSSYKASVGNAYLEWVLFNYGRYLLVGSSRGSLPANLQGKWASDISNAWSADYHANINLQMNYWFAELTNLPEVTQPLWDYMEKTWAPRGAETALTLYNISRGWVTHNEIFGSTGMKLSTNADQWANYPESNAWMMVHVWDHFDFTHDITWWKTQGWPLLKGVAQFHLDKLILDEHFNDTTLVVAPCNSPEQAPITFGCAHAQQLIWQLFNAVDKGFAASGDTDVAFLNEVRTKRVQMDSGIHIGSWGQLQEWKLDMDQPDDTHRHLSHLVGLYPGYAIASFNATLQASYLPSGKLANYTLEDVFTATNTSLTHRGIGTGPDADSGWEKVWRAACWAQLRNTDMFYFELSYALERNFGSNLFSLYSPDSAPFQIDANFGFPAALLNGLIQAPDTANLDEPLIVTLLPTLPADKWPSGSISGARIRGGMTVSFSWDAGAPTSGTAVVDGSGTLARDVIVIYKGKTIASFNTTTSATINLAF